MFKIFKKKTTVPVSNETKEVESLQSWRVSWNSAHGRYPYNSWKTEVEFFLDPQKAHDFAESLRKAFALTRCVGSADVTVTKNS